MPVPRLLPVPLPSPQLLCPRWHLLLMWLWLGRLLPPTCKAAMDPVLTCARWAAAMDDLAAAFGALTLSDRRAFCVRTVGCGSAEVDDLVAAFSDLNLDGAGAVQVRVVCLANADVDALAEAFDALCLSD